MQIGLYDLTYCLSYLWYMMFCHLGWPESLEFPWLSRRWGHTWGMNVVRRGKDYCLSISVPQSYLLVLGCRGRECVGACDFVCVLACVCGYPRQWEEYSGNSEYIRERHLIRPLIDNNLPHCTGDYICNNPTQAHTHHASAHTQTQMMTATHLNVIWLLCLPGIPDIWAVCLSVCVQGQSLAIACFHWPIRFYTMQSYRVLYSPDNWIEGHHGDVDTVLSAVFALLPNGKG